MAFHIELKPDFNHESRTPQEEEWEVQAREASFCSPSPHREPGAVLGTVPLLMDRALSNSQTGLEGNLGVEKASDVPQDKVSIFIFWKFHVTALESRAQVESEPLPVPRPSYSPHDISAPGLQAQTHWFR